MQVILWIDLFPECPKISKICQAGCKTLLIND